MDIYSKLKLLMEQNNVSAYRLAKDLSLSSGLLSQWKKRSQSPSGQKLKLVADYFGVTVDYLLSDAAPQAGTSEQAEDTMTAPPKTASGIVPASGSPAHVSPANPSQAGSGQTHARSASPPQADSVQAQAGPGADAKKKPAAKQDSGELTMDAFTYALYNESQELTEENKQKLLEMARLFKLAQQAQKDG